MYYGESRIIDHKVCRVYQFTVETEAHAFAIKFAAIDYEKISITCYKVTL